MLNREDLLQAGANLDELKETTEKPRPMTWGEFLVGLRFNPTKNNLVYKIKCQAALLIDMLQSIPLHCEDKETSEEVYNERKRLHGLAEKCFEEGAMWAVKKATKGE